MPYLVAEPIAELQARTPTALFAPLRLWHLLSLDAPSVAVLWMLFFPGIAATAHRTHEAAALGLAVWILYVADRLLDARSGNGMLRDRHLFHHRHRRVLLAMVACVAPLLLLLVATLPAAVRTGWLLLSLPLCAYAAVIHRWRPQRLPKEFIVAVFFAVAVVLPAFSQRPHSASVLTQAALFAGLCWMNCVAIARWEPVPKISWARSETPPEARSTAWGSRHLLAVGVVLIALFAFIAVLSPGRRPDLCFALAGALSASLLLLLDRKRRYLGATELRSLADAALLTPLLLWPFLR